MTREEANINCLAAIAAGRKTFTGMPCKRGGHMKRLIINQGCVECANQRRATPEGRMAQRKSQQQYNRSPRGRATNRRFDSSPGGQASHRRYNSSPRRIIDRREYENSQRKENIYFKLRSYLRIRLCSAIRNNAKSGSAVRDLGCSIASFKQWIEQQFKPGMSWSNWGSWHLDHKRPLKSFDLTDREQFLLAAHYTNYQPLWAEENLRKSSRIQD